MSLNYVGGHAGDVETALVMSIQPELVHMEKADPEGWKNLDRLDRFHRLTP